MSGEVSDMSKKISELERVSALQDDDLLVMQNGEQSYKLKFADFKKYAVENISSYIGLSSAAFCDASQFAKFAHGHNYTDFWFFPSYGPDSKNTGYPEESCTYCGKFTVRKYIPGETRDENPKHYYDKDIKVYTPPPQFKVVNPFEGMRKNAGELAFFIPKDAREYITQVLGQKIKDGNIDIDDENFNGYVLPNGHTFYCQSDEFLEACKLYSANHDPNATSFTVPDFSNMFFKCSPELVDYDVKHPGQTALPAHTHEMTSSGDMITNSNITTGGFSVIPTRTGKQYNNSLHSGAVKTNKGIVGNIPIKITGTQFNPLHISRVQIEEVEAGSSSIPDYADLLVMIYIGKK